MLFALVCKIIRKKGEAQSQKTSSILLWDDNSERAKSTLSKLLESPLPKASEIILLGAASKIQLDKSPESASPLAETEKFDRSAALNFAVPKANGAILVVTRPGSAIDRYSIKAIVECIAESGFDCVFGISNVRPQFIHHSRWLVSLSQDANITNLSAWPSIFAIKKESWQFISSGDDDDIEFAIALDTIKRKGLVGICSASETTFVEPKKFMEAAALMGRTMIGEARALFARASLLNPLRFGITSVRLWVEKILLWLSPFFMYTAFLANFILALLYRTPTYQIPMFLQSAFYFMALLGHGRWKQNKTGALVSTFRFVQSSFAAAWMWQNYAKR